MRGSAHLVVRSRRRASCDGPRSKELCVAARERPEIDRTGPERLDDESLSPLSPSLLALVPSETPRVSTVRVWVPLWRGACALGTPARFWEPNRSF